MPINNTKYNIANTKLKLDIINNSFPQPLYYDNKIITCNIFDVYYLDQGKWNLVKLYLNSKANFLINEYFICKNSVTQFNNEKKIYQFQPGSRDNSSIPISEIQIQKELQNQIRVPSSLYIMNKSSLNINSDNLHSNNRNWHNMSDRKIKHGKINQIKSSIKANSGVDLKHNSYARHLGKLKSQNLKTEQSSNYIIPLFGNKTKKFGIANCISNC